MFIVKILTTIHEVWATDNYSVWTFKNNTSVHELTNLIQFQYMPSITPFVYMFSVIFLGNLYFYTRLKKINLVEHILQRFVLKWTHSSPLYTTTLKERKGWSDQNLTLRLLIYLLPRQIEFGWFYLNDRRKLFYSVIWWRNNNKFIFGSHWIWRGSQKN